MERVAEHTARIVLRHGLDGVTHAKVARAAEVSRPWLYKYIGRDRPSLVDFMVTHFGVRLAELDDRPRCDSRAHWEDDSVAGLQVMARHAAAAPWVLPLYFRHVGQDNPVGVRIAEIERRYLQTAVHELTQVGVADRASAPTLAELIHAMRLGIVHRHQLLGIAGDAELTRSADVFRRWLHGL